MERLLRQFIVGSSFPCFVITLFYTSKAYLKNPIKELSFPHFAIILPILFGVANIIVLNLNIKGNLRTKFLIFGAVFGHLLSLYGTFVKQLPVKLFQFPTNRWYLPLLFAPFMYAAIWGLLIYQVNKINKLF